MAEAGHGSAPDFLYGPALLCITDDGTINQVRIRMSREGTAETPTFQAILGTTPALFWNVVTGTLSQRVYDSTAGTLDLGALSGTHVLPMIMNNRFYGDLSTPWYYQAVAGQVTFTFTPQL